jgi:hypothetical protein
MTKLSFMIKGLLGRERIAKSISPIHFSKRKTPELTEGGNYFVSFGSNDTYPCKLIKIINVNGSPEVEIEIPMKPMSKKGFIDSNGKLSHNWSSNHILFADEIGLTREEAVINTVSS